MILPTGPVVVALLEHRWLAPGAVVVCERQRVRGSAAPVAWPDGIVVEACRSHGQTELQFLRVV